MFACFVARRWHSLLISVLCFSALGISNGSAADLSSIASDYVRTDFTIEDGLPDNTINCITQTSNGLLWVGTESGLASFDGRTFTPIRLRIPGAVPPSSITSLVEGNDGDLWVGTDAGVIRIPKADLNNPYLATSTAYRVGKDRSDEVEVLLKARNGTLWAGTNHGLYRFTGSDFVAMLPSIYVSRVQQAMDGRLLLITGEGLVDFDGRTATRHPGIGAQFGVDDEQIFDVYQDSGGTIWYGTNQGVRSTGSHAPERLLPLQAAHTATFHIVSDPHGVLWLSTGEGVYRVSGENLQSPAPRLRPRAFYAGNDSSLWIGTNGGGLSHLQRRLVRVYTQADGLQNDIVMAVMRASDGLLWVGNNCGLARFDGTRFRTFNESDGLLNSCVWALAEDHKHNIWIGTYNGGLFRYNGKFTQFTREQGLVSTIVFQIEVAQDDSLWIATPDGLSHMEGGRIRNYTMRDGLASNRVLDVHHDAAGTMWVATQGGINRYVKDRFVRVRAGPGDDVLARRFAEDAHGHLYTLNAPLGISRLKKDETVSIDNTLNLMEMAKTSGHDAWFSSHDGLIRISQNDLERLGDAGQLLNYERIDRADGLLTTQASVGSPNITMAPDGRLWLATVNGLATIDTKKLAQNLRRPKIFVSDAIVDGKRTRVQNELVLPAGDHHLELSLAAVDLAAAQKIRLQYRLLGIDSGWLILNSSRQVVYTNIPAGTYRLLVRATDSRGTWSDSQAVYAVKQEPFFYQTPLFGLSALALLLLLLAFIYVARTRHLVRQTRAIIEERQVERESVARDLHDTFLQGIQGLVLRFHTGTQQLPADQPVRSHFEEALRQSDQVMIEGRNVLSRLRERTASPESLAEAFSALGHEYRGLRNSAQFNVSVNGHPRDLSGMVHEEIFKTGREALFNAFRHAQAKTIEAEIQFGWFEFRVRVRDDGLGIDPLVLRQDSRSGHYGFSGMKERVASIGGHLNVWTRIGAGTEIDIRIPGAIAYRYSNLRQRRTWLRRLLRVEQP